MNVFPPPFPRTPTDQTSFSIGPNKSLPSPTTHQRQYHPSSPSHSPSSPAHGSPNHSNHSNHSNSPPSDRPNYHSTTSNTGRHPSSSNSPALSPMINVTTSSPPPATTAGRHQGSGNSPISYSSGGQARSVHGSGDGISTARGGSPARVLGLGMGMGPMASPGGLGGGSGSGGSAAGNLAAVMSSPSQPSPSNTGQGGGSTVTPLDVDTVLKNHDGNVMAGLRQVIEDRNSLAQQNAQLWKVMEKYSARMADIVKERERYRSERDGAISRLSEHEGGGGESERGEEVDLGSPSQEHAQLRTVAGGLTGPGINVGRARAGTVTVSTGGLDSGSLLVRPAAPPRSSSDNISPRNVASAVMTSSIPSPSGSPQSSSSPISLMSDTASALRARTLSSTSMQNESPNQPSRTSSVSSNAPTASTGSASVPTSPLDSIGAGNLARSGGMAPSPLSQELSYVPTSASAGGDIATARPGRSTIQAQSLLPSPPIGSATAGSYITRTRSPESLHLPNRSTGPSIDTGARARKMSDMPRSPSHSLGSASADERDRLSTRGQSMSAASVMSPADHGLGIGIPRMATTDSAERPGSERKSETASPDITSLYGYSSSVASTSQPSPQMTTSQQQSPQKISLTSQLLPYTRCDIPSGRIIQNAQGKDMLSFDISITLKPPGTGRTVQWESRKLFSAFLELDEEVTRKAGGRRGAKQAGIMTLPDGRARKDAAPSKADQRRAALEAYLQCVLAAPLDDKSALCRFLTTNIINSGGAPAQNTSQGGRKMGYLTKKGKNLGGWKTRFFVLDGLSLHYFEKRDGDHLGTIPLTAAQIGRQHKDPKSDDGNEKAYRHAFLILEEDRRKNGNPSRHVLCAESDTDRDAWVQALVRAVRGDFVERSSAEPKAPRPSTDGGRISADGSRSTVRQSPVVEQPRVMPDIPRRQQSKGEGSAGQYAPGVTLARPIENQISSATSSPQQPERKQSSEVPRGAMHIPHLSASSIASAPVISASASAPVDGGGLLGGLDRERVQAPGQSHSGATLNANSALTTPTKAPRPQSMMPFKSDRSIETTGRNLARGPPLNTTILQASRDVPESPDRDNRINRGQISGPTGGAPIPPGFRFGASRDPAADQQEKDRKHKSMRLWGFGKQGPAAVVPIPKPVFGVTLAESVAVAEVANLPATVFRCIKYLEAKHAETEEGIFRLSGSSAVIRALKDRFDAEGDIDLIARDEHWDLHAIAGLLKLFLRELATSLLTPDLHMDFVRVLDMAETVDRVREFARLVAALPLANYSLLRALISHLILIATNSDVNKMTLRNIGIVFSPTLGLPAGIFFDLVAHFQAIFDPEPEEEDDSESLDSPTPASPLDQRFSTDDGAEHDGRPSLEDNAIRDDTPRARRQPSGEVEHRNRNNRNSMIYAAESDPMLGSKGRHMPDTDQDDDRRSSIISEGEAYSSEEAFASESGEGSMTVQEHANVDDERPTFADVREEDGGSS